MVGLLLSIALVASEMDADLVELLGPVEAATEAATVGTPYDLGLMLKLSGSTSARDPNTALLPGDGGDWDTDGLLVPRDRSRYGSLAASFFGELEIGSQAWLSWLLDSGELRRGSTLTPAEDGWVSNGRPLGEAVKSFAWVRELYVETGNDGLSLSLGRKRSRLGDGLVYDDYGTGAWLAAGGRDLRFTASGRVVGDRFVQGQPASPLLSASAAYVVSPFEEIGVYGATFIDRGGALRDVLASGLSESVVERMQDVDTPLANLTGNLALDRIFDDERQSHGRLTYLGAAGNLVPHPGLSVRADAVASFGRLEVDGEAGRSYTLSLRGRAADAEVRADVSRSVSLGLLGFALSGDEPPRLRDESATYRAFVAVAPYWTWTGLFFSGGLNQGFYASRAASAGVNGHGVAGGGPDLAVSTDTLDIDARLVFLRALADAPALDGAGSGRGYGTELDARASWKQSSLVTLAAEVDLLRPGSFFASSDLAYRVLAMAYVDVD